MSNLLEDLRSRGLLHQITHEAELHRHLSESRAIYAGFDPTADSLTIGNLLPLLALRRCQRAGHHPVVVAGGGTGLIGDPSGKQSERPLRSADEVAANVEGQKKIFERLFDFEGSRAAQVVNNLDWLGPLSFLDVLRDIGKHFSVNAMIQRDSVRERLQQREQGISYTEFSYMLLQAYDFQCLHERYGVSVQLGGSDQWGNIVAGVDLIKKTSKTDAFGLTVPLLVKSDGTKFGKTESGSIWISAPRTSAYAFHQFWLNTSDADLELYLQRFSSFGAEQIAELMAAHSADPGARVPQRALARELTELLHGPTAATEAEQASLALFSGNVSELSLTTLEEVFAHVPSTTHPKQGLDGGMAPTELLVDAGIAKSKREARQLIESGAVSVNGQRVELEANVSHSQLLHGQLVLLRKGKKSWHVCRFA